MNNLAGFQFQGKKAIKEATSGSNDGEIIRISVPPLSEERRKEYVKSAKKHGEDGKVAVRNIRRDAMDDLDKLKKEGDLTEDDLKRQQDEVQKLTDRHVKDIDDLIASKEKELMEF